MSVRLCCVSVFGLCYIHFTAFCLGGLFLSGHSIVFGAWPAAVPVCYSDRPAICNDVLWQQVHTINSLYRQRLSILINININPYKYAFKRSTVHEVKFSSIITTPLLTNGLEEVTFLATKRSWYSSRMKKAYVTSRVVWLFPFSLRYCLHSDLIPPLSQTSKLWIISISSISIINPSRKLCNCFKLDIIPLRLYTVFRKKHPLTFSFIYPWMICGFRQKLLGIYLRNGRFWQCKN